MRSWPLLLVLLCLGGCQCHRDPEADAPVGTVAAIPDGTTQPPPAGEDPAVVRAQQADRQQNEALAAAGTTVHSYLAALPRGAQGNADSFWTGGKPSPVPDDANLRQVDALSSLRIQTGIPTALDRELPTRAVEVPVELTARTVHGVRRFNGWYRLRPRVDGTGWEITSASLQPVLD